MRRLPVLLVPLFLAAACGEPPLRPNLGPADQPIEAISLLGDSLRRPVPDSAALIVMTAQLDSAKRAWEADSGSADSYIWWGRRTAYLGRFQESLTIYNFGIDAWPDDPRLYRHRGHRLITTRQFVAALADFARAAELIEGTEDQAEPDGQPNALNIPTSTLHGNIWYHYALTRYLLGDFEGALELQRKDLDVARNADSEVAVRYWLYMTLRRLGRDAEAAEVLEPVTADMEIIENGAYHRLLLLNKGLLSADSLGVAADGNAALQDATTGYGIGNWHFYNGREAEAWAVWRRVVETGPWASFGYIAAEAEFARRAGAEGR